MLESEHKMESVLCRENIFLAQNVFFVSIAFTVLLGTTFPLLAEAVRGTKLSIQAPFFNTVTSPMGYALLFLMGVGTLIPWRRASWESMRRNFLNPVLTATLITLLLFFLLRNNPVGWEGYAIFWCSGFVTSTIVFELFRAIRVKRSQTSTAAPTAFLLVISRNLRRYGGLLIHFGVVLMFLGFAGQMFNQERDITLKKNEPAAMGDYLLVFKEVSEFRVNNATHRAAVIEVYDQEERLLDVLKPAKSFYPTQPQPLTEVAIRRTFWEDLYLIFSSEDGEAAKTVTLRVFINPLTGWAWMALPVFTLGVGICFLYRPQRMIARESVIRERYLAAQKAEMTGS